MRRNGTAIFEELSDPEGMYHQLLVHIVWTTRDRQPLIDRPRAEYLWKHLPIIARQERARVLEIGIVATHLHLLLRLHPSTVIPACCNA